MTFIYETSPTTCDLGSSCHAQADDYQQPLEFGVRDGYAYHVFGTLDSLKRQRQAPSPFAAILIAVAMVT